MNYNINSYINVFHYTLYGQTCYHMTSKDLDIFLLNIVSIYFSSKMVILTPKKRRKKQTTKKKDSTQTGKSVNINKYKS